MGLVPDTVCRRCGTQYTALRSRCPNCGMPRENQPTRVPPTTASAMPDTAASRRSSVNIRWQFVFGAILVVAVLLAVVVLVTTGGSANKTTTPKPSKKDPVSPGQVSSIYTAYDLPSPSPSPEPTPEASPTPEIESMGISFMNNILGPDITINREGELTLDLDVNTHPATDSPVTWKSSNEKILTVDDRGIVTIVGANPTGVVHAVISAECCGIMKYVVIYVPAFQSTYLNNNLYDPETYESDNAEWDAIIYATPAPST